MEKKSTSKQNGPHDGDLAPVKQPLSASKYAALTFLLLAIGAAFVWFYASQASKMGQDLNCRIYFLVLIVWGLICASYLIGTMRGSLVIRYKGLIASGSTAVLLAILILGMKFAHCGPSTFDLTIRLCQSDGKTPVLKQGDIMVDLNNDRRQEKIDSKGEANFKGIPGSVDGSVIPVTPMVDGYKRESIRVELTSHVLCIPLTLDPNSTAGSQTSKVNQKEIDQIKKLMASEANLVRSNSRDESTAEQYGNLFAADAWIADSGSTRVVQGQAAIMARFRQVEQFLELHHRLTSGPFINNNSATAEAKTEFLMKEPGPNQNPNGFGKEQWTFIKKGDQWRIQGFRYNVP